MLSLQETLILDGIVASYRGRVAQEGAYSIAADAIMHGLFKQQAAVVRDPCRRKAALCPRRAGKSWTSMSYAFHTSLTKANARVVICLLVLKQAKQIYWHDMQQYARTYGLGLKWHLHDMTISFTNGSVIQLIGAESYEEIEKLRGGKFDLAIIDECKSFAPDILQYLTEDVLQPALADRQGTMLLIGTPGNVLQGPFCWATLPGYELQLRDGSKRPFSRSFDSPEQYWVDHPDSRLFWSRHSWGVADNVAAPHLAQEAADVKATHDWPDDHPTWRREWCGEWVAAVGVHVYAYADLIRTAPESCSWSPQQGTPHGLPAGHDWRFIMGLDLGFEDDFAIVVGAYSMTDGKFYHVFDWKENHKDIDYIAAKISDVYDRFGGFDAMVGDWGGLGTLVLETVNKRHGWNIQPAEKRQKFDHVELLNSDFISGRIRIMNSSNLSLELRTLQWLLDEHEDKALLARTGKLKENPAQPNHLCDAWLYAWRYSMHHWAADAVKATPLYSAEWYADQERLAMDRLVAARADRLQAGMYAEVPSNPSMTVSADYFGSFN